MRPTDAKVVKGEKEAEFANAPCSAPVSDPCYFAYFCLGAEEARAKRLPSDGTAERRPALKGRKAKATTLLEISHRTHQATLVRSFHRRVRSIYICAAAEIELLCTWMGMRRCLMIIGSLAETSIEREPSDTEPAKADTAVSTSVREGDARTLRLASTSSSVSMSLTMISNTMSRT